MQITFEAEITPDGTIQLPEKFRHLAPCRVSVTITEVVSETERKQKKVDIMKFAGIWEGLSDEELGLDDLHERRKHFFGDRDVKG